MKLDNEKQCSQPSTVVDRVASNDSARLRTLLLVDVEPDYGFAETADIPSEPGVQPDPAVQVAPIAPPARHTRCGRLVRPPARFNIACYLTNTINRPIT